MTNKTNQPAGQSWFFNSGMQNETSAELYFYGDVSNTDYSSWSDDGIFTNQVRQTLQEVRGKDLTIHINSYGGDVYGGYAIYSLIKQHDKKVTAVIDGVAMSAASVIALAADEVQMSEAGIFMIHNVWTVAMGDSSALREKAEHLDKLGSIANDIYARKTGKSAEEIQQLMDNETFMTAEEALAYGFIDSIISDKLPVQMSGDKLILGGVDVTEFKDKLNLAKLSVQSPPVVNSIFNQPFLGVKPVENNNQTQQPATAQQPATNPAGFSLTELKSQHPDVYQAAIDEERLRLQGIEELSVSGFEDLVMKAKFSEPMTPGDFAIALNKAQKDKNLLIQQQYLNQVQASGVNNITGDGITNSTSGTTAAAQGAADDEAELKMFAKVVKLLPNATK